MKTIKFILLSALSFFICHTSFSQTIEKKIDGVVYVCDTVGKTIENKSNQDYRKQNINNHCPISFNQDTPIKDCFKKTFSKERADELKETPITLYYTCNSFGEIIQIRFLMRNAYYKISLSEIKKLEDACIGYKFRIGGACNDQKFYYGGILLKFKDLYKDK